MKFVAYILSLYILLLSCIPCADAEHETADSCKQQEVAAIEQHHHTDSCPEDDCSPFCICECCHIQVTIYEYMEDDFTLFNSQLHSKLGHYLQFHSKQYLSKVLDPPELLA